LAIGYLSAVES